MTDSLCTAIARLCDHCKHHSGPHEGEPNIAEVLRRIEAHAPAGRRISATEWTNWMTGRVPMRAMTQAWLSQAVDEALREIETDPERARKLAKGDEDA